MQAPTAPGDSAATVAFEGSRSGRHADRLRALYEQTPATLTGNLLGMLVIGAMFWQLAERPLIAGWLAAAVLLWLLRLAHYLRYRREREQADDATLIGWRGTWRALLLLQGTLLGLAVWLFWGLGSPFHVVALIVVVYAFALGAVQLLAAQPPVFLAYIGLVLLPTIARVASDTSQPWHWELAGVLTLVFGMTLLLARTYRDALGQAIALKGRTDQLAVQLRIEKAAADEARRAAEAASRAKTQFFAAASHDLRQPLHAMGLFAEALRQRVSHPEVVSLVDSINESVDALEGLFGELLDITRIDTGGVEVRAGPVPMKDLFARLRLHFEPIAFEKGLALSFRGAARVVHSDALLVERILRNLVSNAIRYTEDGGVLVACRSRRGRLAVQVWDSGIGIAEASLPHIFDEFYQVSSTRPLDQHQRKGLGLGLAIVKRLAVLLDAPLTVHSRVGRGTVFTLELPPGREAPGLAPLPLSSSPALGLSLDGRRVLVVEDEPAVREGLSVLLRAWGAEVQAHDTLAALQAELADSALAAPDLVIVDYRLPGGATGIDALTALRARWPQARLPAIVITGSSMGGHENEAAQHDFHLLIKPVLPYKLRAMIAFKLSARPDREGH